ncbi:hypothetical protein [Microbulbifer sp. PSTR4-B]|uniref:hypothetical protein n=1 Tax=unclassified Microbulbifer TaxID=2619833 RepID=UPI00403B1951
MLIRIETGELIEFPEDLAARVLIDPFSDNGDKQALTAEEVNVALHSILGTYFDPDLSREDNIKAVKEIYDQFKPPSAESLRWAQESIRAYVREVEEADIGSVDSDYLKLFSATEQERQFAKSLIKPKTIKKLPDR